MLEEYDPMQAPDPDEWLAMDEDDRRFLVEQYHRDLGEAAPNPTLQAMFHVVVESQVALGDETPVAATLERLTRQGLDRHEAIHAIGAVLSWTLYGVVQEEDDEFANPDEAYYGELERLTPESWRREFGEDG